MTIRFRLPAEGAERVAFAYSPLLELVLSLHVLVEPKHHPLQQPWVRQMRALPAPLRREIGAFAFAYRSYFPGFLIPGPAGSNPTLDDVLGEPSEPGEFVLQGGVGPRGPRYQEAREVGPVGERERADLAPQRRRERAHLPHPGLL